jgi:hypothetical protein
VAGRVLKRVKSVFKGFWAGAKVIKPNAKLDAISGHKLSSVSGAISGRGSGLGCLQRSTEVLGSALRPDVTSTANSGVDLGLSHSGGGGLAAHSSGRVRQAGYRSSPPSGAGVASSGASK